MSKLPIRNRSHVIEEESRRFVRSTLPSDWLIDDGRQDYGIDLFVEIVWNKQVTGATFLIQLKGTDNLKIRPDGYVVHRCKTQTLSYFLERPEPIVYLVYDAQRKTGYWIWIQDHIRQALKPGWRKQKTATISIPVARVFDATAIEEIARRALKYREQAKWLAAIHSAQSPFFRYGLEATEESVTINIGSKYPEALQDSPVTVSGIFKFDRSDPAAAEALANLDRHFKTGEPVELDRRFFEGFDIPQPFASLIGHEELHTTSLRLGAANTGAKFLFKISVLDQDDCVLAEIPYIEMKVIQAGTEEMTLSNREQDIPLKMSLKVNRREQTTSVSMKFELVGLSAVRARDLLRIQRAMTKGAWLVLQDLSSGLSDRAKLPKDATITFDERLFAVINALSFIQETTNQIVVWPGEISAVEAITMAKVIDILQSGHLLVAVNRFHIGIAKSGAEHLLTIYRSEGEPLKYNMPDYVLNLLGAPLSLGPVKLVMPRAKLSETTQAKLDLEQHPDDTIILVDFDILEPGAIFFFERWLPQDAKSIDEVVAEMLEKE